MNEIGRALLGTSGARNVQPSFVSEPAGPFGIAVDGLIDPTHTTASCGAGRKLSSGSRVAVVLVKAPKPRRRR